MGWASARGLKVGNSVLLRSSYGEAMCADTLYLVTNKREGAIHLYEKPGFQHDAEIMAKYGSRYESCDVAMRYNG